VLLPNESVNNSGANQIAVVVSSRYLPEVLENIPSELQILQSMNESLHVVIAELTVSVQLQSPSAVNMPTCLHSVTTVAEVHASFKEVDSPLQPQHSRPLSPILEGGETTNTLLGKKV